MSFIIICLYSNYMAVGKIKEGLKMLLQQSRSLFCFLTKMAWVLGKNTIVTSSMTPINDVLLHRAFYKGLKNTQVLMGQRWCILFQMKNNVIFLLCSICSPYNFFPALYKLSNYEGLRKKGPGNTVSFTWQQFVQGPSLCHIRNHMRAKCTVCDRRAWGFYFCALLGSLRQHVQCDCERWGCCWGHLCSLGTSDWALLRLGQPWGCAGSVAAQSWAIITLKPFSGFPEWEEGRHGETCLPSDSKIIW